MWAAKHPEAAGHGGPPPQLGSAQHDEHVHVHLPDPSYWPLVSSLGLFIAGGGVLLTASMGYSLLAVTGVGLLVLMIGIFGWSLEPVNG